MTQRRNPVLVAWLTVVTFGFYFPIWLGITWNEMRAELKNSGMRPFGHALSIFVPVYGLFRLDDHFRTLNSLARNVGARRLANRGIIIVCFGIALLAAGPSNVFLVGALFDAGIGLPLAVFIPFGAAVVSCAFIVGHGQEVLNEHWRANPSARAAGRTQKIEQAVAIIGSLNLLWVVVFWSIRITRHQ